jgi:hypothetical protein
MSNAFLKILIGIYFSYTLAASKVIQYLTWRKGKSQSFLPLIELLKRVFSNQFAKNWIKAFEEQKRN